MKIAEIVAKTDKELTTLLTEQKAKLAELRIDYKTKQVTNVKEIAAVRKSIAQVNTIMRERAITAEEAKHE